MKMGKSDESISDFENVIKLDPSANDYRLHLVAVLFESEKVDKALKGKKITKRRHFTST